MFRIGQKVVCIRNYVRLPRRHPWLTCPQKNVVYTVRAHCDRGAEPGVLLEEIVHRLHVRFEATGRLGEPSFKMSSFRPLVERTTDISIFTAMLTSNKVDA